MGTRADFYVGRGEDAEWLGSIAWDGYPGGVETGVLVCVKEAAYRVQVDRFLSSREDATRPEMGWPWPWETSHTTDYAYTFDGDTVWGSSFGREWFRATAEPASWDEENEREIEHPKLPADAFPDMSARKNVQIGGKRSGIMVISAPIGDADGI